MLIQQALVEAMTLCIKDMGNIRVHRKDNEQEIIFTIDSTGDRPTLSITEVENSGRTHVQLNLEDILADDWTITTHLSSC